MKKSVFAGFCLIFAISFLSACGASENTSSAPTSRTNTANVTGSPSMVTNQQANTASSVNSAANMPVANNR